MVNLALDALGIGVDTRCVIPLRTDGLSTVCCLNPHAEFTCSSWELRGPEPREFLLPRPDRGFRVIVAGASTVQGYPYASELSFPHQLELILQKQLHGRTVEVLNAGIVGLSSGPLVEIIRQAVKAEPDLVVLYCGHNEFYGIGGVASTAQFNSADVVLRSFRLGQLLSGADSQERRLKTELIESLPEDVQIPIDSPVISQAEDRYRESLNAVCDTCARAGIPLVLCRVVSNLRNQSPLLMEETSGETEEKFRELRKLADSELQANDPKAAALNLREALTLAPKNAVLHYRLAQCLEQSGQSADALQHFTLARDFDGCRYRAPSSFRGIVQSVAAENASDGVILTDLVPVFVAAAANSAPGDDLFLEHVHLSLDGHWLVAISLGKSIVENVCRQAWQPGLIPDEVSR